MKYIIKIYGLFFAWSFIIGFPIIGVSFFIANFNIFGFFIMVPFILVSFYWFYVCIKAVETKK